MSKTPDKKQFATTGLMAIEFNKLNKAYKVSEGDTIKDVVIVQTGEADGHYVNINQDFIKDTVRLGNAAGVIKCRVGHPKESWYSTDGGGEALINFLGAFSNFREDGNRAIADLAIADYSKHAKFILPHAAKYPQFFGNSIVFEYSIFYTKENGESTPDYEYADGDKIKYSIRNVKMEAFRASDLVDEPAATDGLFSVQYHSGENPQPPKPNIPMKKAVFSAKEKASLKRAGKYIAFITITTTDGVDLVITSDDDFPKVGSTIVTTDGANAPDDVHIVKGGDYEGATIETKDGIITVYEPADAEMEEGDEDAPAGDATGDAPVSKEGFAALQKQFAALQKQFAALQKQLAAGPGHTKDEREGDGDGGKKKLSLQDELAKQPWNQ